MLTTRQILDALAETGKCLDWGSEVEIVLAGAAACLITGVITPTLTTTDCDVLDFTPQTVRDAVMRAAMEAAAKLGISRSWLNDNVRDLDAELDMLPVGWESRRRLVNVYGKMRVVALGRFDLLATKLYAGRAKDRDHLKKMGITKDEIGRLREYLQSLDEPYRRNINRARITKSRQLLEALDKEIGR